MDPFLATGEGHGTKKALVAGLLGMQPDDYQIADSFEIAAQRGITVAFGEAHLEEAHPNTAVIRLTGVGEKYTEVQCLPSVVHGSVFDKSQDWHQTTGNFSGGMSDTDRTQYGSAGMYRGSYFQCWQKKKCQHCDHAGVSFCQG